jgi:hypothetical protein
VGVEPTILAAGDRINGFEGHEGHRTPFASGLCKRQSLRGLLNIDNIARRLNLPIVNGMLNHESNK